LTPYNDGDALYTALAQYGDAPRPRATPQGLLVTTVLFSAIMVTPGTELGFLQTAGVRSATRILEVDDEGSRYVTGELAPVTISIVPCGTAGDFDGDCEVTLEDVWDFTDCLVGPEAEYPGPGCEPADFDGDVDVDLRDAALFQRMFTGR
jgi:hypothetical protein